MGLYQYLACGLDYIQLVNGYTLTKLEDGTESVSIDDIFGLHKAIGDFIVCNKGELTGAEFKFLRKEMNLSQKRLATLMGVSESAVRDYEKSRRPVPGPADRLIRTYYANEDIRGLVDRISDIDCEDHLSFVLEETDEGWKAAA